MADKGWQLSLVVAFRGLKSCIAIAQQWLTMAMSVLGVLGVWSGIFLSPAMADEGSCCLL
jgi:hypothetical protein